jgi:hypothetical protein
MEKILIVSITISVLFGIFKFIEMKYIDEEIKPMKIFIRDIVLVFTSAFACSYVIFHFDKNITDFFAVVTDTPSFLPDTTQVFTGEPSF